MCVLLVQLKGVYPQKLFRAEYIIRFNKWTMFALLHLGHLIKLNKAIETRGGTEPWFKHVCTQKHNMDARHLNHNGRQIISLVSYTRRPDYEPNRAGLLLWLRFILIFLRPSWQNSNTMSWNITYLCPFTFSAVSCSQITVNRPT